MYEVLIALVAIANIEVVDNVISVNLRHQIRKFGRTGFIRSRFMALARWRAFCCCIPSRISFRRSLKTGGLR